MSKRFIVITIGSDDKSEQFEHEIAEMMKQRRFTFKDRHYQYTSPTMKGVLTKMAFVEEQEKGGETDEQQKTSTEACTETEGHHNPVAVDQVSHDVQA
jgi:hypothetical protein